MENHQRLIKREQEEKEQKKEKEDQKGNVQNEEKEVQGRRRVDLINHLL